MLIEIHDEALRGLQLTQTQAVLDLAVGVFTERRVTLGLGGAHSNSPPDMNPFCVFGYCLRHATDD